MFKFLGEAMNPGVMFLPIYRATTTAFILGMVVLAIFDAIRIAGWVPDFANNYLMMVVWLGVFSLFANRRRHAGKGFGLAFLPVIVAVLTKGIGALVGMLPPAMESMYAFAAENGVDTDNTAELSSALNDQGFQQAWQQSLTENADGLSMFEAASTWPSFIGFWIVVVLFGFWFAGMKKTGGALPQ
jgi:hypothetical protein